MTRAALVLPLILLTVLFTGCPPGMPGEGGGEGSGEGQGEPEPSNLTLILQSAEPDSGSKRVWVVVDGVGYTRADFPYVSQESSSVSTFEQTHEVSFQAMPEQVVTLIAFDGGDSFFSGVSQFTELDVIQFPDHNEFVEWTGDIGQTEIDNADFGEVSFVMGDDRTITANYRRMPTFVINAIVNDMPAADPAITASVFVDDFLTFPDGEGGPRTEDFGFTNGFDGFQLIGAVRSGSLMELVANPEQADSRLLFIDWTGDCTGRTCMLTVDNNVAMTSNWLRVFDVK